jgi:hypothetical protein
MSAAGGPARVAATLAQIRRVLKNGLEARYSLGAPGRGSSLSEMEPLWSPVVATGGSRRKSTGRSNRRNSRKQLPCVATTCRLKRMVRKGSGGSRAADSARPGGHHGPSSFHPAGTVKAASEALQLHPRSPDRVLRPPSAVPPASRQWSPEQGKQTKQSTAHSRSTERMFARGRQSANPRLTPGVSCVLPGETLGRRQGRRRECGSCPPDRPRCQPGVAGARTRGSRGLVSHWQVKRSPGHLLPASRTRRHHDRVHRRQVASAVLSVEVKGRTHSRQLSSRRALG